RERRHAFRPASIVNVSGMSFGALSGVAVEALNRGAHLAGCLHNTGEGGLSP
ncbi:MAG TPA: FMN-binding glutamate synthase family protein, partial [Gammaproteobacteria bacterium]|nr:FMN-binding glutamate synthase family protein [Gammaproteobacteria bacterium]